MQKTLSTIYIIGFIFYSGIPVACSDNIVNRDPLLEVTEDDSNPNENKANNQFCDGSEDVPDLGPGSP